VNDRPGAPRELAERLAALAPGLELLGLAACVFDHGLRYVHANPAVVAQTGRGLGELLGRTQEEAFGPYSDDGRRENLRRALAGEAVAFTRRSVAGIHKGRWFRAHYFPLREAGGAVWGALLVLVDVQQLKDAEAALEERERDLEAQRKRLQLVLENIGVPMCYVDRELRLRFANQPGIDWQVRTVQEALGRRLDEVFDAATLAIIGPEIDAAMRGEKRVYERLATLPTGERRWVRVFVVPDKDEDGTVRGAYSLVVDVDDDHRMREALQRQEAQLRHFAENLPGPVAVVDANYRYVFANKVFQRMRGLALPEIVGRHVTEVLGEELSKLYFDPFLERLHRGETCTYERRVGPPGTEQRWHLVRVAPILDAQGRFDGAYIVASDVHDLKLGEERLREQQARLRLFADNIPDAVAYLDRDRRILFANRQFAALRGASIEDILGKTTAEAMGPEVAAWIAERTQKVLHRGEVVTYERLTQLPEGEKRWFHVKAVPHFGDAGEVVGMYVVAHDIHEVKAAQARLAAREEELRFFAENIPEAICYVDLERGCTFVNNVFLATRGVSRADAVGKFPADGYPPQVLE
jgi:PAS domain S-box-containing protein